MTTRSESEFTLSYVDELFAPLQVPVETELVQTVDSCITVRSLVTRTHVNLRDVSAFYLLGYGRVGLAA